MRKGKCVICGQEIFLDKIWKNTTLDCIAKAIVLETINILSGLDYINPAKSKIDDDTISEIEAMIVMQLMPEENNAKEN